MSGLISGWIREGVSRHPRLDTMTHALKVLDYSHAKLHSGDFYSRIYSVLSVGALEGPDDMMTLSFTTPDTTTYLHLDFQFMGSAGALTEFVEGKDGGGGTPTGNLSVYNHERNSSNTSTILDVAGANAGTISYGAAEFTGSTTLYKKYLAGNKSSGDAAANASEYILKRNTAYQFTLYNNAANPGTIVLSWYELVSKD